MADLKISQLTGATTPLAGTEVLPIVQSGVTKKVPTDDLTVKNIRSNATTGILQIAGPAVAATRTMTVPDANFTAARTDAAQSFAGDQTLSNGNLIIGTSGKGIDFSATPGTGTSELLADYEEGTWTPVDASGAGLVFSNVSGRYTKIGRLVVAQCNFTFPATASTNTIAINGLPFTLSSSQANRQGFISYKNAAFTVGDTLLPSASSTIFEVRSAGGGNRTNAEYSGAILIATCVYEV